MDEELVLEEEEGSRTTGVNILKRAQNVEISKQQMGYTKVRIYAGQEERGDEEDGESSGDLVDIVYEAGTDGGAVLELRNQLNASQEMAENILASIQGYRYQPLTADTALLDPAAEMGDGVTVNGVYSGIFVRATKFGRLMASDIKAPTEEEIEHEFAVESATDRQYTRFVRQTRAMLSITNQAIRAEVERVNEEVLDENNPTSLKAMLNIQADEISAKVSADTSSNKSTFGWKLTSNSWEVYSNGSTVLKATSSGLEVSGKITATSGSIGGFSIGSSSISYNGQTWGGTKSTGIYIGTSGIQLGKNFKVDSSGALTASSGTFNGTVQAKNIVYGKNNTFDAAGLTDLSITSGKIDDGEVKRVNIGDTAVSAGKTSFSSTLTQVGVNKSNISALSARIASVEAGYFNSISTNSIAFGDYYLYVSGGYVRASLID